VVDFVAVIVVQIEDVFPSGPRNTMDRAVVSFVTDAGAHRRFDSPRH
jgi:hypothetical protein